MSIPAELKDYAVRIGYPESDTLGSIFKILFNEKDDLKVAGALPGTIEEISAKTGLPESRVSETAFRLLMKGAIGVDFKKLNIFRLFPAMIELRDSSVLGKDKPPELFKLWDRLVNSESASMVSGLKKTNVSPMVRVVPVERSVEAKNTILDIDSAVKIFKDADLITAIPCVCRTIARKNGRGADCPAPDSSVCMQTNFYASGVLARQLGEQLTVEDALKRLGDAEDAGLVHMTRNNVQKDMFMCNCCSCCCTGLYFFNELNYSNSIASSRFRVKIDEEACSGCGACSDRCQFKAIKVEETAVIDYDKCYGCGNCVIKCPEDALILEEVRPVEHIRVK